MQRVPPARRSRGWEGTWGGGGPGRSRGARGPGCGDRAHPHWAAPRPCGPVSGALGVSAGGNGKRRGTLAKFWKDVPKPLRRGWGGVAATRLRSSTGRGQIERCSVQCTARFHQRALSEMKAEVPACLSVLLAGKALPCSRESIPRQSLGPTYQSVMGSPHPIHTHTSCIQLPNLNLDFQNNEGLTPILQAWHLREKLPTKSTFQTSDYGETLG